MKNLFKEAHKLTKEIKSEYLEVDYRFQFGLCLAYLQEEGENDMSNVYEDSEYRIETKEIIVKDTKIIVPSTIEDKSRKNVFSLEWNVWSNYGKTRIYCNCPQLGKRFERAGYVGVFEDGIITNELDGVMGTAMRKIYNANYVCKVVFE